VGIFSDNWAKDHKYVLVADNTVSQHISCMVKIASPFPKPKCCVVCDAPVKWLPFASPIHTTLAGRNAWVCEEDCGLLCYSRTMIAIHYTESNSILIVTPYDTIICNGTLNNQKVLDKIIDIKDIKDITEQRMAQWIMLW